MKKQSKRGTSVPLTKREQVLLENYRKGFITEVECALSIGIDRNVLNRIMVFGSGSPESVKKIKEAIGTAELATKKTV